MNNYKIEKSSTRYIHNKPVLEIGGIIPVINEQSVFIDGKRYKVAMITDLMITNEDNTVEFVREVILVEKKYF